MCSTIKLEAIRDPDLSLEQIQRMMRTIFINHSERLSVTKKNPECNRYQGPNRSGRETGRESAKSTALIITCHYCCKKTGHEVRECKKMESDCEMEKSGKLNHEREKNSVVAIKQTVIRISSVTSRQGSRKKSKMKVRKNGVACTIARVIQIKNAFSRVVAVNAWTVLLMMVGIAENMKPLL